MVLHLELFQCIAKLLCPITKDTNSELNQSALEANTCNRWQARENASQHATTDFGCSYWLVEKVSCIALTRHLTMSQAVSLYSVILYSLWCLGLRDVAAVILTGNAKRFKKRASQHVKKNTMCVKICSAQLLRRFAAQFSSWKMKEGKLWDHIE